MENKEVSHNEKKKKFFIDVNGYEARLKYKRREKNILEIHRTEVPHKLRGQGIGKKLIEEVFNYARKYDYKIRATCSFAQKAIAKHAEYKPFLASE